MHSWQGPVQQQLVCNFQTTHKLKLTPNCQNNLTPEHWPHTYKYSPHPNFKLTFPPSPTLHPCNTLSPAENPIPAGAAVAAAPPLTARFPVATPSTEVSAAGAAGNGCRRSASPRSPTASGSAHSKRQRWRQSPMMWLLSRSRAATPS